MEQAASMAETSSEAPSNAVVTLDHLDQRLTPMEANLNQRVAALEANLRAAIAEDRGELLRWMVSLLLGQTVILAALAKLL